MTKQNTTLNLTLSISLLIMLLAIWWFTKQASAPDVANESYLARVSCDLKTKPCVTIINETQIHLAVTSKEVRSFQPLPFIVTFKGIKASNVSIDFQGIEMFMGSNKLALQMSSANTFTGTHTLPGHSGYSMTWRAILTFDHEGNSQETQFEFPLE